MHGGGVVGCGSGFVVIARIQPRVREGVLRGFVLSMKTKKLAERIAGAMELLNRQRALLETGGSSGAVRELGRDASGTLAQALIEVDEIKAQIEAVMRVLNTLPRTKLRGGPYADTYELASAIEGGGS